MAEEITEHKRREARERFYQGKRKPPVKWVRVVCTRAKGDYSGIAPGKSGYVPDWQVAASHGALVISPYTGEGQDPDAPSGFYPDAPEEDPTEVKADPAGDPGDWRALVKEAQSSEDMDRLGELAEDHRRSVSDAARARMALLMG